jgi:predicted NBD/HSP70 family sugar kinase
VDQVCARAGISADQLSAFVIGSPGIVNPRTGDPTFAFNLPEWHEGVLEGLSGALRQPVMIENDVNLAAMAERAAGGAAEDAEDFALVWIGIGLGLATMIGGRLHRGVSGAAGEIGWLPVSGAPVTPDVRVPALGGLQSLVGAESVLRLARRYGLDGQGASGDGSSEDGASKEGASKDDAADCVRAAVAAGATEFLDELAHRVALGATTVCAVLDPGLLVLGGQIGLAGGTALADRVAARMAQMCPVVPQVVPTTVTSDPVLRGALLTAVEQAQTELLASV